MSAERTLVSFHLMHCVCPPASILGSIEAVTLFGLVGIAAMPAFL
jgi:hypothetical protein